MSTSPHPGWVRIAKTWEPSTETIRAECLRIQATWDAETRFKRHHGHRMPDDLVTVVLPEFTTGKTRGVPVYRTIAPSGSSLPVFPNGFPG